MTPFVGRVIDPQIDPDVNLKIIFEMRVCQDLCCVAHGGGRDGVFFKIFLKLLFVVRRK